MPMTRPRTRLILGLSAAPALALLACAATDMPEPDEGRAIYAEYCVACHGPSGRGDGPLAAGLEPMPVDITTLAAENGGVFPRARALSHIDGYTRGDGAMPEFGAVLQGDTVPVETGDGVMTPTPRPLAALLAYLESLQSG